MSIIVRPADSRDLEAVCALFVELFSKSARGRPDLFREPQPEDPAQKARLQQYVIDRMASPTETILIAEESGHTLGFIHVELDPVPESQSVPFRRAALEAWVLHLAVGAPHRRRGVGRTLDEAARSWARAQGAQNVGLQVWAYNEEAARFFEELGYRPRSLRLYHPG